MKKPPHDSGAETVHLVDGAKGTHAMVHLAGHEEKPNKSADHADLNDSNVTATDTKDDTGAAMVDPNLEDVYT